HNSPHVACQCFPSAKNTAESGHILFPFLRKRIAMPSHAAPVAPVTLAKPPKKWQAAFPPSCPRVYADSSAFSAKTVFLFFEA
ncbi:MAG: hypothetical protein U0M82_14165, partial [Bilophila wadsworthia]